MSPQAHSLLKLLEEHPRGKAWSLALRYNLEQKHCTSEMAVKLLERAASGFEDAVAEVPAVDRMQAAWASVEYAKADTPPPRDRQALSLESIAELSHVTCLDTMCLYHFSNVTDVLISTVAGRPGTDPTTHLKIVKRTLRALSKAGKLVPKPGAYLGVKRLWVATAPEGVKPMQPIELATHERDVTGAGAAPHAAGMQPIELATRERDRRGLIHLGAGHFLIQYTIPASPALFVVRPTALDDAGVRFRPWSNQAAHEPFGTAVDLNKFAVARSDIDGIAEGLASHYALLDGVVSQVSAFGCPQMIDGAVFRGQAPDGSDGDESFFQRLHDEVERENWFPYPDRPLTTFFGSAA